MQANNAPSVTGARYAALPITSSSTFTLESSVGLIQFAIAGTAPDAKPVITLEVTSQTYNGASIITTVDNVTLDLDVKASGSKSKAFWIKKDAHQMSVKVITLTGVPTSGWDNLTLTTAIITSAYDDLALTPNFTNFKHTYNSDGTLNIVWDKITGAERYELEWTYVSGMDRTTLMANTPESDTTFQSSTEVDILSNTFKNNSSRVSLTGNSFSIPMVYEKGYIVYRLRAVSKRYAGTSLVEYKSDWSNNDLTDTKLASWKTGTDNHFHFYNGIDRLKNWQSSISFAEEGKTKTVVTYHDGSMRNRQAVTKINSDNRAIVGETLYDYAGRPLIQLLPVPTNNTSLAYYPNFNVTTSNTSYIKKDDYVLMSSGTNTCSSLSPEFSPQTGAANYYSPSNSFDILNPGETPTTGKIINRNLIPQAEGYPYTQTSYTPDNTGKIQEQSGVGKNHTIGSGHGTQYLYSTPEQKELSRLFGTEVGNASHYKKNVVIDANGQASVSYLDLDGKVVATALAGDKPLNVTKLDGANVKLNEEDILAGNYNNLLNSTGTEKTFTKKIVVTSDKTYYNFDYKANAVPFILNCDYNTSASKSFNGVLKSEMKLVDKCGIELFTGSSATSSGYTGTTQAMSVNKNITLGQGEYTLTKTLKLDDKALEKYWSDYLLDPTTNCLKTLEQFEVEQQGQLGLTDCNFTCGECETLLSNTTPDNKDYLLLKKICESLCRDVDPCSASLDAMKADMSKSGQYGQIRAEQASLPASNDPKIGSDGQVVKGDKQIEINTQGGSQPVDPTKFPLSIFNDNNALSPQFTIAGTPIKPSWKTPIQITLVDGGGISHKDNANSVLMNYKIEGFTSFSYEVFNYYTNNKLATIKVTKSTTGTTTTYSPEIDNDGKTYFTNNAGTATSFEIPVKYLVKFTDFEKLWKPEWGNYLVAYHPEWKYYVDCRTNASIYAFDVKMARCTTLAKAQEDGLITPTANNTATNPDYTPNILANDPIQNSFKNYVTNTGLAFNWPYQYLVNKNALYGTDTKVNPNVNLSMIEMATTISRCPNETATKDFCAAASLQCKGTTIKTEMDWIMYRSLYMGERQKVIRLWINENAAKNLYYNGCIGHNDYLNNGNATPFRRPFWYLQTEKTVSDCHGYWPWCGRTKKIKANSFVLRIPRSIPNQPCYDGLASLYVKKQQRFFPTMSANTEKGTEMAKTCNSSSKFTYLDDKGVEVTEYITEPCSTDIVAALDKGILNAQRQKYEQCGLCPLALEIQDFQVQLFDLKSTDFTTKRKALFDQTTPLEVNCTNSTAKLPGNLAKLFDVAGQTTTPSIKWHAEMGVERKSMTGYIVSGTKQITIQLALPLPDIDNQLRSSITLDSIISMCCLDIDRSTPLVTNRFFIKANYLNPKANQDAVKVIYLNGSLSVQNLSLNIDNCSFPPQCALTDKANATASFLNLLALQLKDNANPANITKPSYLLATTDQSLKGPVDDESDLLLYAPSLRTILSIPFDPTGGLYSDIQAKNPTWRQTTGNNLLTGTLTTTNGYVKIYIDFNNSGYIYNPDTFVEFVNLEPVAGDGFSMKAQVKYKIAPTAGSGVTYDYAYAPVIIRASYKLSACLPVVSKPKDVVPKYVHK